MMLWIAGAGLALMTLAFLLSPILRKGSGAARVDRDEGALAIFADQIKEVDREARDGVISPDDAAAAKAEIKRRMLAVSRQGKTAVISEGGRGAILAAVVATFAVAGVTYSFVGNPGTQSLPYAMRASERAEDTEVARLTSELRSRLLSDENGGPTDGWMLLGQTYMRMNRYGDAALAFARVVDRPEADSGMLTQYAEALIASEDGIVTNRAAVVLERAAMMDPDNPAATYYRAQWLDQEGRSADARALLTDRVAREGSYQPWMDVFISQINRISADSGAPQVSVEDFVSRPRGPSAEDMQAAQDMTPEERMDFVRSMVEGLAARLQDEPEDLDGWLQLGRAYTVLGQSDDALAAYEAASGLLGDLPEGDPRRNVVAEGLAANGG